MCKIASGTNSRFVSLRPLGVRAVPFCSGLRRFLCWKRGPSASSVVGGRPFSSSHLDITTASGFILPGILDAGLGGVLQLELCVEKWLLGIHPLLASWPVAMSAKADDVVSVGTAVLLFVASTTVDTGDLTW